MYMYIYNSLPKMYERISHYSFYLFFLMISNVEHLFMFSPTCCPFGLPCINIYASLQSIC